MCVGHNAPFPQLFCANENWAQTLHFSKIKTEAAQPIEVAAASSRIVPVSLLIDPATAIPGSYKVKFTLSPADKPEQGVTEKSSFLVR